MKYESHPKLYYVDAQDGSLTFHKPVHILFESLSDKFHKSKCNITWMQP